MFWVSLHNVLSLFWICLHIVLSLFWQFFELVFTMFWVCFYNVLVSFYTMFWSCFTMFWVSFRNAFSWFTQSFEFVFYTMFWVVLSDTPSLCVTCVEERVGFYCDTTNFGISYPPSSHIWSKMVMMITVNMKMTIQFRRHNNAQFCH